MNRRRAEATQIFGIIGESLNHSLSPIIHNHFLQQEGLAATYTIFPVAGNNLAPAIEGMRVLGVRGVNITNPYKEQVIPLLDGLARTAQRIGAVNTIKNIRGRLVGHNTDLFGVKATLRNRIQRSLHGEAIFLLGTGGVARACLAELVGRRVGSIFLFVRSPARAQKMIATVCSQSTKKHIEIQPWNSLKQAVSDYQPVIVLNATSAPPQQVGKILKILARLSGHRMPVFLDVNYGLRAVPDNGRPRPVKYVDGLYMLAAQAAESFRIWTGRSLDPDSVYRYARRRILEN